MSLPQLGWPLEILNGYIIGKPRLVIGVPPWIAYVAGFLLGQIMGDVMITPDEVKGLMAGLLYVESPPAGTTRLTDWAKENAASLGARYASEVLRRTDRHRAYDQL